MTTLTQTTHTIAGCTVTLHAGFRYWASRPWASKGKRTYQVTIEPIGAVPDMVRRRARFETFALSYDQANAFINAFNNGPMSFDGREWK